MNFQLFGPVLRCFVLFDVILLDLLGAWRFTR